MNRIAELRQGIGMTQDELGKVLNVGKGAVSRYEQEKRQLTPEAIHALCDMFNCSADYLLGRSSTPIPMITDQEAEFLAAYRAAPEHVRTAIDTLLTPHKEKEGRAVS